MSGRIAFQTCLLLFSLLAAQCGAPNGDSASSSGPSSMADIRFGDGVAAYDVSVLRDIALQGTDVHAVQGLWRGHEDVMGIRDGVPKTVKREIRLLLGPDGRAVWAKYMPAPGGGLRRGSRVPGTWAATQDGIELQFAVPGHPRRSDPRAASVVGDVLTTTELYHSDWGGPGPKWTSVEVRLQRVP